MMKNKVYYGEYSLDYWIKLILKKDVVLPDYQRYFVWNKEQVKTLINTLKDGFFIPPITIGACIVGGKEKNIIIDGQQRLTSILLAYLGVYPKDNSFKEDIVDFADASLPRKWTFREITDNFNSVDEIRNALIEDKNYQKLDIEISKDFLRSTYIGFSYIVPEIPDYTNSQVQQNYFSTIFRYINRQGTVLKEIESRKALYFLDSNLVKWFEPKLLYKNSTGTDRKNIRIPFDYIRYVSVLTEYNKRHNIDKNTAIRIADCIPSTDKKDLEKYYERYIYTFTDFEFEDKENALKQFGTLNDLYNDGNFSEQILKIQKCIDELEFAQVQLTSLISLDVYFYGLIYNLLFLKRDIDLTKKDKLKSSLEREVKKFSKDTAHVKSQNNKSYWAQRIEKSINIYRHYLNK